MNIAHITTVHQRGDSRITLKECAALSGVGLGVQLIVADGNGGELVGEVRIRDVGGYVGRFARGTYIAWRVRREVVRSGAHVCHFHDPELIFVGMSLKPLGVKVIYDAHEDVPRQIMSKHWIPGWARKLVSATVESVESMAGRLFDGIVAATPTIAARFPEAKTVTVQNFPMLSELHAPDPIPMHERPVQAAYVGGIAAIRGAKEMVKALEMVPERYGLRLALGGTCSPASLRDELSAMPGWELVDELGWVKRPAVASMLARSRMGLVVLHPTENYPEAYPVKMFEYMSAGVPVIASDFPLWREIVEGAGCGLVVNPLDPAAIAMAMQWLLDHPAEAEEMGQRGREAVVEKYNWEAESKKLIAFYERLGAGERVSV